MQNEAMAAAILTASASAFASASSERLITQYPKIKQQFGQSAFAEWKDHFQQRVRELAAALAENEPRLFTSRVLWARVAFQAREVQQELLRESLICLRDTLHEELPESCRQAPGKFIDVALDSLKAAESESSEPNANDPNAKLGMQYLLKILEGDSRGATCLILDAVKGGLSLADAYEHVLLAAQREVGRMWHQAEVNVAEEHLVTATTIRTMSVLCHQATPKPSNSLTVVAGAVAKNPHEIGIRAISDFFELAGWKAICLGGDTPANDFAQAVKCFNADLALISAALSTQLTAVRQTIEAIRKLKPECKIMVGGSAFVDAPEIWQQTGADGYAATLSASLETGDQLVGRKSESPTPN